MNSSWLPLFSPALRTYVRQLGAPLDLGGELHCSPKQTEAVLIRYTYKIKERLFLFYKIVNRIDRSLLTQKEVASVKWFLENRTLLGEHVRSALQEAQRFHDRLDGKGLVALAATTALYIKKQAFILIEDSFFETIAEFTKLTPLSTDEANCLPFLTRLHLLSEVVTLSETLLKKILAQEAHASLTLWSFTRRAIRLQAVSKLPITYTVPSNTNEHELLAQIERLIETVRNFADLDWETLISQSSAIDTILARDPSGMYAQMTIASRFIYKERLRFIARSTQIDEQRLTTEALLLAEAAQIPYERHIGYWFMDEGSTRLLRTFPATHHSFAFTFTKLLRQVYLPLLFGVTFLAAGLMSLTFPVVTLPLVIFLAFFPILRIVKRLLNSSVNTFVAPTSLPTLELTRDLSLENATMFVIPAFLSDEAGLKELLYSLEVAYLGNSGTHIHFGLLLDFPDSTTLPDASKQALKERMKEAITAINTRYGAANTFFVFFRSSHFNEQEGVFMAWERKRGKLLEFMRTLRSQATTSQTELFPPLPLHAEFVVIVDEDAHVPCDFVRQLIAIHAHPLRRPHLGAYGQPPHHGSTFVQPTVRLWFQERNQLLPRIFSEEAPSGYYSTQLSETYQDLFGSGSFVGKGSIHIDAYLSSLEHFFPENQILSHDLLEGSVAGTTFANNVVLYDEFPTSVSAYLSRLHRWIRGDWQTIPWLFRTVRHTDHASHTNMLGTLEKFKIFDNLVESFVPVAFLGLFCLSTLLRGPQALIGGLGVFVLDQFGVIDLVFQSVRLLRSFSRLQTVGTISRIAVFGRSHARALRRSCVELGLFPYVAGSSIDAIIRACYRQIVSHYHLLEWNTASSEKRRNRWKKDLRALLPGFLVTCFLGGCMAYNTRSPLLGILVVILFGSVPFIIRLRSKIPVSVYKPTNDDRILLDTVAKRTWDYYVQIVNTDTAFLPPDHVQEFFQQKVADYTSVSNVGFYLLSIVSATKLGFISSEEAETRITQTIGTLEQLPRYASVFYNWYSLHTFEQDTSHFVSSVDAGNLLACLITVSSWLTTQTQPTAHTVYGRVETLIHSMSFRALTSRRKLLLAIGFDPVSEKLSPFFYQTLASESRLSVLLLLAKRDLPLQAWNALSRLRKRQPVSAPAALAWSGTLFEYLMPRLFIKDPPGSLMDVSSRSAYANHRALLASRGLYGALSESAYGAFNSNNDYAYKAFGIQSLALYPQADDRSVVSPYAVILALAVDPKNALQDLHKLAPRGLDRFGFFEAIDYETDTTGQLVGTYMSHHQGMILGAITNFLHDDYIQKLFSSHPLVQNTLFLIDELPTPLTKELFPEK